MQIDTYTRYLLIICQFVEQRTRQSRETDKVEQGDRQGRARGQTRRSREIDKAVQGDRQGGARR